MYRRQFDNDVSGLVYAHVERIVKKIMKCL